MTYPPLGEVFTLALDPSDDIGDSFLAPTPRPGQAMLFGGQLLGQAMLAANASVRPQLFLHSAYTNFFRAGEPDIPLRLQVARLHDGGRFAGRQVVGYQNDAAVIATTASFHSGEPGDDWQQPFEPGPHPDTIERRPWAMDRTLVQRNFDFRPIRNGRAESNWELELWTRCTSPMPPLPGMDAAVLSYVSDFGITRPARLRAGPEATFATTVTHTLWFHRPVRTTDVWLRLFAAHSSVAGGRTLAHGTIHTVDGVHAASFAQEVLVRVPT